MHNPSLPTSPAGGRRPGIGVTSDSMNEGSLPLPDCSEPRQRVSWENVPP
ncbi:hypothetical protein HMPREF9622_01129 [Cutibacterium modestum HL037PA3]|uniref:Uncharacterized protein n=1 Tax=Cutibacterium modestum HL044PA1 TaxID=765109 RepID=A0ABN0C3G6_9ACTN|nr:hypothetical protein HMPREF9621_00743 [Cutibacterium modestum HL037PA2]EFS91762.1 hypothetical protein HMPREF9607_01921 [Cutibacterium modestum HL044PA1]EFT15878.1 hypothetical protein HMPREF9622_01129 [Cutibacterium modestum HL037PA3]